MKTQCPHCSSKFNAPDNSVGKKAKCPKCSQSFVIVSLQEKPVLEKCSKCGCVINEIEQPCVFHGQIVCAECDKKLRMDSGVISAPLQKSKDVPLNPANTHSSSEEAIDKDISEVPGLERAEIQVPEQKENKTSGATEIVKCTDCGESFSKDEAAASYKRWYTCKPCFQKQMEKAKSEEWGYGKRILVGLPLCTLGVLMIIVAIGLFLQGGGSLEGTAMAGGALAIGGPPLYFGIRCLFSSNLR